MKALSLSPGYVMSGWRKAVTKTILVMKLTGFLLVAGMLQVSAAGRAQTITYQGRSQPLTDVLKVITKQTGYTFFYDHDDLAGIGPVTVEWHETPLRDALEAILADKPLAYEIQGNTILLVRKEGGVLAARPTARVDSVPRAKIYGRVVDSTGVPLVGASVRIKGTKKGTSTNIKGDFALVAPEGPAVIVVSYTSYETQEIKVSGLENITVRLKYSSSPLDEVHVIAYGTTTERYNVGSIARISAEQIEAQPVPNVLQALEGQVPGLEVVQSSGLAGASLSVQIHGQNTLAYSQAGNYVGGFSTPLFVIDGVPFAPQNNNINQLNSAFAPINNENQNPYYSVQPGLSPFNTIPPDDIESIEVLKDADATAIYGSRGANGVILITTKKGKAGKTEVHASIQSGFSQAGRTMTMMNEQQYLQMRYAAINNDNLTLASAYDPDLTLFDTTKNTNWKQQFLSGTSQYTSANLSLTGGTNTDNFRVGGTYKLQNDMYPGGYGQHTMSVDAAFHHASLDNRFSLDFHGSYGYAPNNTPGTPSVLQAFQLPPDYPNLLDSHGNLVWIYNGFDLSNYLGNTLAYLKGTAQSQVYTLGSGLTLKYKILPGLDFSTLLGYNTTTNNELSENPLAAQDPAQSPVSSASYGYGNFALWSIDPMLYYHKTIGRHTISVQVGAHFEQNSTTQNYQTGSDYANDALLGSVGNAATKSAGSTGSLTKRVDNFFRIGDVYNKEFILEFTGNRDASSRFGPGRQFGNFYSVAGGWIFSELDWLKKNFPALSYGKLKTSYGLTGSDAIGDYQYQANYRVLSGYTFQGMSGYYPTNLANPDYSWSITRELSLGLDIGLFKDRISAGFDYHINRTGNQLLPYTLPLQTGFNSVVENAPYVIQDKGWDLFLSTRNIRSRNFNWSSTFNIGANHNIVASFPGLSTSSYAGQYIIGKSQSIQYLIKYDGVNPQTGTFQYLTAKGAVTTNPNGNPPLEGGDANQVMSPDPAFSGGMGNTFTYKHFSLYIFCQFKKQPGYSTLEQIYNTSPAMPGFTYNEPAFLLKDAWSKPGQQTNVEKFTATGSSLTDDVAAFYAASTAAYTDASFIRVKTVQVSYGLPVALLKRLGLKACNVSFSAQNLFTITRYQGDPETQNLYTIPPMKTVTLGINLTL